MNTIVIRRVAFLCAALCVPSHLFAAYPYPYSIKTVAQLGDVLRGTKVVGAVDNPEINNLGQVAYRVGIINGGEGIVTTAGTTVLTGDVVGGTQLTSIGSPAFNDSGEIAYRAQYGTGTSGIYTSHELIATKNTVIGGRIITGFSTQTPSINNEGTIAFTAAASNGSGLFTQSKLVASVGQTIDGITFTNGPNSPTINNSGDISFRSNSALFVNDHSVIKPGTVIDGHVITGISIPSGKTLNDLGQTAVYAEYFNGSGIVFDGHFIVTTGMTVDGLTLTSIGSSTVLNNSGTVVYQGFYNGGVGAFTQDGVIVKTGDIIDGKQVSQMGSSSINNLGQIAMEVQFTNSTEAIMVFTPVPEPASIVMGATGALFLLMVGWRRRSNHLAR